MTVTVVINTLNEEKNLPRALASIKSIADEIVVVDMESTDKTVAIAKKEGAKVYSHKPVGYVEPDRNFAISKANCDWILILDADEEIKPELAKKLKIIAKSKKPSDFYRLPRKNIVFKKWLKHSRWWPDYNIRFFKKGAVSWNEVIHSVPETKGEGLDLPAQEKFAIIHHHYETVAQYLERHNRYSTVLATELQKKGYEFYSLDLIKKPLGEFLSRYFAGEGYKDGVHGLALSALQAFVELTVYIKVWEKEGFQESEITQKQISTQFSKSEFELDYWLRNTGIRKYNLPEKFLRRLLQK